MIKLNQSFVGNINFVIKASSHLPLHLIVLSTITLKWSYLWNGGFRQNQTLKVAQLNVKQKVYINKHLIKLGNITCINSI